MGWKRQVGHQIANGTCLPHLNAEAIVQEGVTLSVTDKAAHPQSELL